MEEQPFGIFKPNRGLCQGDPLSPYLFLICAEGLSYLLHNMEQCKKFQGIKINNRCLSINHLLFMDDSLLFSKASPTHCANVLEVLKTYKRHSGQMVNLNKSVIFFNCNTPSSAKSPIGTTNVSASCRWSR